MTRNKRIFGVRANYLKIWGPIVAASLLALAAWLYLRHHSVDVLNPSGEIASKQYRLIVFATLLSLVVIVPVFIMTFVIVRNYRVHGDGKTRKNRHYDPDWDHNRKLEAVWWGMPTILIIILSAVIIQSSYALDPFKPLASNGKEPLKVQVVALQWKWLFIYPEQNIATVNYLQIPTDTAINFDITADAPMNSFWIPKLGGQIYAMSGMATQLHLQADKPGDFYGSSANLSGNGFAGMRFLTRAVPQDDFDNWVQNVQHDRSSLNQTAYEKLAKPSKNVEPQFYTVPDKSLFSTIIMKYMPPGQEGTMHTSHGEIEGSL